MRKIALVLLLLSAAALLAICCDGNNPEVQKEETLSAETERIYLAYNAGMMAAMQESQSAAVQFTETAERTSIVFRSFRFTSKDYGEIVLNGTVTKTKDEAVMDFGKGSSIKGVEHTVYAKAKLSSDGKVTGELIVDGRKILSIEKILDGIKPLIEEE